jgi:hypothetical protein
MRTHHNPQCLRQSHRELAPTYGNRRFGAIQSLRLFIPLLLLAWGAIAPTVAWAGDITYQILNGGIYPNGTLSGTITTNGTTGTDLSPADIVSWDITATGGTLTGGSVTLTPANSPDLYGVFNATDQVITLSPGGTLGMQSSFSPYYPTFRWDSYELGGTSYTDWDAFNAPGSFASGYYPEGDSPVATVLPEPSTAMLAGFGAVGVLVYG